MRRENTASRTHSNLSHVDRAWDSIPAIARARDVPGIVRTVEQGILGPDVRSGHVARQPFGERHLEGGAGEIAEGSDAFYFIGLVLGYARGGMAARDTFVRCAAGIV